MKSRHGTNGPRFRSFPKAISPKTAAGPGKYRVAPGRRWRRNCASRATVSPSGRYRPDTGEYFENTPGRSRRPAHRGAGPDRQARPARHLAREEQFVVDGKPVDHLCGDLERNQWPRGSIEGAQHTMYRIDRQSFVVYKAITYSPKHHGDCSLIVWSGRTSLCPNRSFICAVRLGTCCFFSRRCSRVQAAGGRRGAGISRCPIRRQPSTLREFQGKVIIVDFWATLVRALPRPHAAPAKECTSIGKSAALCSSGWMSARMPPRSKTLRAPRAFTSLC